MTSTKLYDKVFITGCDSNNEWQLPWFFENYKKHNDTPLVFADFGVEDIEAVKPHVHAVVDLTKVQERGWFKKPKAIFHCPAKQKVWLDTDCEIRGNISGIFGLLKPQMLNMIEDKPWAKRRGGVQYNSGVVGVIDKPVILGMWAQWVQEGGEVGDQEVLTANLNPITAIKYINSLPNEYNWLRLQIENDNEPATNARIVHWTGAKGNDRIRSMMNG
jgi:hypothetical protein